MKHPSLRKLLRKATVSPKPSVPPKRYRLSPAQQLTPTGKRTQVTVPPRPLAQPAPKVKRALSEGARRALAYALQNSDYALLYAPIDNTLWMSTHLALLDVHKDLASYPDITVEDINEAQMGVANAMDTGTTLQELIFTPILSDTQARAAMMAVKRDLPQAKIGQRVENLQAGYVASTDSDMETQLNREVQAGEMGTIIDVEVSPDYNLYIAMLDDGGYMSFSDYEVADGMVAWRSKKPVKRKAVKRAAPPPNVQSVLVQLHNGSSYVTFDWGNPYDLGAQVADMLVMNAEEAGNWIGANPDDYFDWAINMGWIDEDGNEL